MDENLLERAVLGEKWWWMSLHLGGSDPQGRCAAGTWCRQERRMGGWWPSRWAPSCEQSVEDQQHREEAPCPQPRLPWYAPHTRMGSLPA